MKWTVFDDDDSEWRRTVDVFVGYSDGCWANPFFVYFFQDVSDYWSCCWWNGTWHRWMDKLACCFDWDFKRNAGQTVFSVKNNKCTFW